GQPNSRIDLWHIATKHGAVIHQTRTERDFFMQLIRDHLRMIRQSHCKISSMLRIVQSTWDTAMTITDNINLVNTTFPTKVNKTSGASIEIVSSVLVTDVETKVDVILSLIGTVASDGIHLAIEPGARLV